MPLNDTLSLNPYDHLGLEQTLVRLAAYSDYWPPLFLKEKMRLSEVLAPLPHLAEHIGSTAVKGLRAKPIVDIALGIPAEHPRRPYIDRLRDLGYTDHGEKGVPGRSFLSAGDPPLFHLHMIELGCDLWKNHLLFRDQLRADPALARRYEVLKAALAQEFRCDRDSYTRAKADFIETTLRDAQNKPR